MKTQHTLNSEQWRICCDSITGKPLLYDNGAHVKVILGNEGCAMVGSLCTARLIASAPELLSALEAVLKECALVHKHWGEGCNLQQAKAAKELARAAIAKARGEA